MRTFVVYLVLLPTLLFAHHTLTRNAYRSGRIRALQKKGNNYVVHLSTGVLDIKDVVALHFERSLMRPKEGFFVVFAGGCWLYAKTVAYNTKSERLTVDSRFGKMSVGADYVRCVLRAKGGKEWKLACKWGRERARRDVLLLEGAKPVRGRLLTITTKTVTFDSKTLGGKVDVKVGDIVGVVFITTLKKEKQPEGGVLVKAYLTDGSVITGALVNAEGRKLSLKTLSLGTIIITLDEIESLYVLHPDIVFLSDLEPADVKETPLFDRFLYPWQRDRSLEHKRAIMVHGRIFWKGISCHSRCALTYDLAGKYEAFCALAALDDEARGEGNVDMAVFVDGKKSWEKKGVTGQDRETFLRVDLRGAKKMSLLVDFGKKLHILDRAVWADAFLIKKIEESGK